MFSARAARHEPTEVEMPLDLNPLTDEQRAAVLHGDGPVCIIAVPGSGKTTCLSYRAAYLILERGVDPDRILAMTFARGAAGEITQRLEGLGAKGGRVGTIHSVAYEILCRHGSDFGADFEVDERNKLRFVARDVLQDLDAGLPPDLLIRYICYAKACGLSGMAAFADDDVLRKAASEVVDPDATD